MYKITQRSDGKFVWVQQDESQHTLLTSEVAYETEAECQEALDKVLMEIAESKTSTPYQEEKNKMAQQNNEKTN